MEDEFDCGLDSDFDAPEVFEPDTFEQSLDVDSFMDDVPDFSDSDFGEMDDSFESSLDIDSVMNDAALDGETSPEIIDDIPEEPVVEEIPEVPVEEIAEDIPDVPEISEEAVAEDIPDIPEISEEALAEDIPDVPEISEEALAEDIPDVPEISEEAVAEDVTTSPEESMEALGEDVPPIGEEPVTEYPPDIEEAPLSDDLPEQETPETEDLPGSDLPPEVGDTPENTDTEESEFVSDLTDASETEEIAESGDPPEEAELSGQPDIPETDTAPEGEMTPGQENPSEFASEIPQEDDLIPETVSDMADPDVPVDSESGSAYDAMFDYINQHGYSQQDYEIYSKDPEWQQLNNDLLVEMGREPIDYAAVPDTPPERIYDDFESTILESKPEFYEDGTFYEQGVNEFGYSGTCGETSMANTMNRVLETNEFTENKVLNVAVQEGLCDTGSFSDSGGTTTSQFMDLYEKMNEQSGGQLDIQCHDFENVLSMEDVANKLDEGCTINVAVDSDTLWDISDPMGSPFPEIRATDHWITVTGVHRGDDGVIQGFDIIDSGGGVNYVDADKYQAMCYGTENLELTDPTCIVVRKVDTGSDTASDITPAAEMQDIPQIPESQDVPVIEPLKPNDTYESNGYTYQTDAQGRIISASGELHLCETMDRDPTAQLQAGGDSREDTDDGGHLIATRFGGSPGLDNLVAENSFINRSQYKQLENAWARDLAAGNRVIVNIEPNYATDVERPTHIAGSYTVIRPDGKQFSETFSLTNDDLRAPEYQMDFGDGDSSFYESLSVEEREAYEEAMAVKPPKIDEGRVFQ